MTMSRRNKCNHPDCDALKPVDMYACRSHWFRLPVGLRMEILRAFAQKGALSPEWLAAHGKAVAFWKGVRDAHT